MVSSAEPSMVFLRAVGRGPRFTSGQASSTWSRKQWPGRAAPKILFPAALTDLRPGPGMLARKGHQQVFIIKGAAAQPDSLKGGPGWRHRFRRFSAIRA